MIIILRIKCKYYSKTHAILHSFIIPYSRIRPYLLIDGKKKYGVWIIALLDNTSRMVTGIDIFFHNNFANIMSAIKTSVSIYEKARVLNLDNGSSYKNK